MGQQNILPQEYLTDTYKQRMEVFQQENGRKFSTIFLGNSLTQGGQWASYFPEEVVLNRGISGDNTAGVLARLGDITELAPKKIFLLIGINDISQNYDNQYIINQYKKIIAQIKDESPATQLYIQSLLPINNDFGRYKRLIAKEKQIKQLNKKLRCLSKKEKLIYINVYPAFLDGNNKLKADYTHDGLHLNEAGYAVWVDMLTKFVITMD